MKLYTKFFSVLFALLIASCATNKIQINDKLVENFNANGKTISHSFYLVGDAGSYKAKKTNEVLKNLKNKLKDESSNSSIIFLGDNIYPNGLPKKHHKDYAKATQSLKNQLDIVEDFKGSTHFIPGNHDWYASDGLKGLKRQEKYIENALGKDAFFPNNGCPIDKINISDNIVLIVIDTQWYLEDWDNHPTINDDCEIKTREKFFNEFEGLIKKNRDKTTLVAMHHPLFSNGPHGGQYSAKQHLMPVPLVGSLLNLIRKTGGISTQDIVNKNYIKLRNRIVTLAQESTKVVFVSGHEHSLQYIKQDNTPQIISGSGSKVSATKNTGKGVFSYGGSGYAKLDVYTDGSSKVSFYSVNSGKEEMVFSTTVIETEKKEMLKTYPEVTEKSKKTTIYSKEETEKSGFYKFLWGERYRKYYSTEVEAPIVDLDTIFGGLTPVRKGGGHQSKSLRLKDKNGKEYVMRALRKSAVKYIQAVGFKDKYVAGQFDNTVAQKQLLDIFTASHPYAPFTIGVLSDAVGVYHSNPSLFYIPKQKALKQFNKDFGDELYMIEERAASKHGELASFGHSNTLISTDDLIKKLRKSDKNFLDQEAYIKARLFDMLIGDWDRHEDQWRWAKFDTPDGKHMYRPVPRDRDQAFSIMNDGALLGFATAVTPPLRLFEKYDEELKHPKWFNIEPYPLDILLLSKSNQTVWDAQVTYIQKNLTDQVIDEAFKLFPKEVQDNTIDIIKNKLKGRRKNLKTISDSYFKHLEKYVVLKGTDKPNYFDISALPNKQTNIKIYSVKNDKKDKLLLNRTYTNTDTKEIWVYGLDGEDIFEVVGKQHIKMRLIGGQNNDKYMVENGAKVLIYDYKSKHNDFKAASKAKVNKTDNYEINTYNYKKNKHYTNKLIPNIGANPDDGLSVGFTELFTQNGFIRNPFTSQHKLSANYYFSTSGFDVAYHGEFANFIGNANLIVDGKFTDANFADNFFGIGNETDYDDEIDLDYYRVKQSSYGGALGLRFRGNQGAVISLKGSYESVKLENTEDRILVNEAGTLGLSSATEANVFERQSFVGTAFNYSYENYNNAANPTLGMHFEFETNYKLNTDNTSRSIFNIKPSFGVIRNLTKDHKLVLASKVASHINFGDQDDLEIYQLAFLGGVYGLRGFNNERFSGKHSFYSSSDIRFNFRKLKSGFLPLNIGFFGGYDVGRVWADNNPSDKWHSSVGGGLWLTIAELLTTQIGYFNSDDGSRIVFKLGFGI